MRLRVCVYVCVYCDVNLKSFYVTSVTDWVICQVLRKIHSCITKDEGKGSC